MPRIIDANEFKDKVNELINNLDPNLDVFISVLDTTTGDGFSFGFGCQACHAKQIVKLHEINWFKHSTKQGIH